MDYPAPHLSFSNFRRENNQDPPIKNVREHLIISDALIRYPRNLLQPYGDGSSSSDDLNQVHFNGWNSFASSYFNFTTFAYFTSSVKPPKINDYDTNSSFSQDVTTDDNSSSANVYDLNNNEDAEEAVNVLAFHDLCLVGLICLLIVVTVIGNTLVILAVLTTRRLRTVTNCFVTSLAVADWLVGIFVMPPAVALHLMGSWRLGTVLCDIWISMDVLLCTASILSLCAISVDRYLAVTQPLKYSRRRRSKRLALIMILAVWAVALAITCPPMLGWYEIEREECRYNQNPGYVVFSAMGSFFIPMVVMMYVYIRISCVVARRHQQLSSASAIKGPKRFSRWACLRAESDMSESLNQASNQPQNHSTQQQPPANNPDNTQTNHNNTQTKTKEPPQQSYELLPTRQCCFSCENIKKKHHSHHCRQANAINRSATNFQIQTEGEEVLKRSATVTYKTSKVSRISIRSKPNSVNEHSLEHQNNRVSSLRRETKTAQTLSIVVGGFVLCWLPFFIYYILTPFLPKHYVNPVLMSFLTWLGWFNSAINPFIYAFYSPDFRVAFWRLTVKRCSRDSRRADFALQHK